VSCRFLMPERADGKEDQGARGAAAIGEIK
jgi:hypothetical protein